MKTPTTKKVAPTARLAADEIGARLQPNGFRSFAKASEIDRVSQVIARHLSAIVHEEAGLADELAEAGRSLAMVAQKFIAARSADRITEARVLVSLENEAASALLLFKEAIGEYENNREQ